MKKIQKDSLAEKYRTPNYTTIDSIHFEPVIEGMSNVVKWGTARVARVPGVEVCGKTVNVLCDMRGNIIMKNLYFFVVKELSVNFIKPSHLFDEFLKTKTSPKEQIAITHEQRSCDIFRRIVREYNLDFSVEEVDWICEHITSPPNDMWYDTLVCNPYSSFDTDKLDYLIRDTKHFGLVCSFDIHRIIQNMRIIDNKVCFCERVEDDIRNMFSLREQLHQSIYRHPTIQKFDSFFLSVLTMIRFECRSMDDFLQLQDVSVLMMFPFSIRKQFECRKWESFHEQTYTTNYKDNQKDVALSNLLWFRRKSPHLYFTLEKV